MNDKELKQEFKQLWKKKKMSDRDKFCELGWWILLAIFLYLLFR